MFKFYIFILHYVASFVKINFRKKGKNLYKNVFFPLKENDLHVNLIQRTIKMGGAL